MRLGVYIGDTVNVVSPAGRSARWHDPENRTFAVVGIFQSGMYEYDSSLAYIELAEAQKFFNMESTVTGIEVKVTDVFRAGGYRPIDRAATRLFTIGRGTGCR